MDIKIVNSLQTERLGNCLWVLLTPFKFSVNDVHYKVPAGFVTDGASGPELLWHFCAPMAGPFGEAAVAHDYFYSCKGPRKMCQRYADRVLYEIGLHRGARKIIAILVKKVANKFGHRYYRVKKEKLRKETCYKLNWAISRVKYLEKLN